MPFRASCSICVSDCDANAHLTTCQHFLCARCVQKYPNKGHCPRCQKPCKTVLLSSPSFPKEFAERLQFDVKRQLQLALQSIEVQQRLEVQTNQRLKEIVTTLNGQNRHFAQQLQDAQALIRRREEEIAALHNQMQQLQQQLQQQQQQPYRAPSPFHLDPTPTPLQHAGGSALSSSSATAHRGSNSVVAQHNMSGSSTGWMAPSMDVSSTSAALRSLNNSNSLHSNPPQQGPAWATTTGTPTAGGGGFGTPQPRPSVAAVASQPLIGWGRTESLKRPRDPSAAGGGGGGGQSLASLVYRPPTTMGGGSHAQPPPSQQQHQVSSQQQGGLMLGTPHPGTPQPTALHSFHLATPALTIRDGMEGGPIRPMALPKLQSLLPPNQGLARVVHSSSGHVS